MNLFQIDYTISYGPGGYNNNTAYVVSDTDQNALAKLQSTLTLNGGQLQINSVNCIIQGLITQPRLSIRQADGLGWQADAGSKCHAVGKMEDLASHPAESFLRKCLLGIGVLRVCLETFNQDAQDDLLSEHIEHAAGFKKGVFSQTSHGLNWIAFFLK